MVRWSVENRVGRSCPVQNRPGSRHPARDVRVRVWHMCPQRLRPAAVTPANHWRERAFAGGGALAQRDRV